MSKCFGKSGVNESIFGSRGWELGVGNKVHVIIVYYSTFPSIQFNVCNVHGS